MNLSSIPKVPKDLKNVVFVPLFFNCFNICNPQSLFVLWFNPIHVAFLLQINIYAILAVLPCTEKNGKP